MPKPRNAEASPASAEPATPETLPTLIPIAGGDSRLPQGLHLGDGAWFAEVLPDGRVVPQRLPPATLARFYPDLAPQASPPAPAPDSAEAPPPPPTVEEV